MIVTAVVCDSDEMNITIYIKNLPQVFTIKKIIKTKPNMLLF